MKAKIGNAQPKRPRKPRNHAHAILTKQFADDYYVRLCIDPGSGGGWGLDLRTVRALAKRLVEMADWLDAQKPRVAKRERR